MTSFVLDTSGLISLEIVGLLESVLNNFDIVSTSQALGEIRDFAVFDDELGLAAQRVLKRRITIEKPELLEELTHVSHTDNGLFNLALSKNITLITDDIKLTRHAAEKIKTEFSTYFLGVFVAAGLLRKAEAMGKLEHMRKVRNWQDNVIYISAKEELDDTED